MDRAAGAITHQLGQPKTFGHDALARKGRIAMQQEAHDARARYIAFLFLFCTVAAEKLIRTALQNNNLLAHFAQ